MYTVRIVDSSATRLCEAEMIHIEVIESWFES